MDNINVLIADTNLLVREGLKSVIQSDKELQVIGVAANMEELEHVLTNAKIDIITLDFDDEPFSIDAIKKIKKKYPHTKFVIITQNNDRKQLMDIVLTHAMNCLIFKDCDEYEVVDSIKAAAKNKKFYCGKLLDILSNGNYHVEEICAPVKLSVREMEIVKLVAAGLTSKQIAERLFISEHTVYTHRKNISKKTGFKSPSDWLYFAIDSLKV